ncbi:hypothetical protein BS329_35920 [Amycolatopsis coloradensis]|uniref:Aldehyde dehydrogenase domain-containing protein n=1 Tax=Amycolatopsis coloradensis TaxID=76021 RepID=A0A1R0KGD3_9PSEU|nr:hypothetical protein BS329_35920 [Amycolatopsis coloradensis]
MGPLVNDAALARTAGFIERAKADGTRVVTGGHRPPGWEADFFHEPTLLTDVPRRTERAQEEVFGPVTAVLTYRDFDDALALAHDTGFGLAATVYTTDRDAAAVGPAVTAPFGGRNGSGWGRESGPEGIQEFTKLKQILFGPFSTSPVRRCRIWSRAAGHWSPLLDRRTDRRPARSGRVHGGQGGDHRPHEMARP